jgi:WD40 repeat protein
MHYPHCLAAVLLTATAGLAAAAAPPEKPTPIAVTIPARKEPVSYAKEVADILDAKCVGCHNGALAESKLNLEDVAGMLKGGKRGPAIVAGKADQSLLFQLAAHRAEPPMPPPDKKDQTPLTPEELGLLKLWIDTGAKDDSETNPQQPKPIELGSLPPGVHPIVAVDMIGEGNRVAAGRANVVQVYDVDSGLEIIALGGHKDIIQSLRFSPDGRLLAAGSYQIVTVWNAPTGGLKATYAGHADQVKAVVSLPDRSGVVSGGLDRTVRFWDPAGKQTRQVDTPAPAQALAVAPDGTSLAVGGADNLVRILDAAGGKPKVELAGHSGPVTGVGFLAGGKRVASVSADGTARVWTLTGGEDGAPGEPLVLAAEGGPRPLRALAVRPDGEGLATAGDEGTIRIWEVDGDGGRCVVTIGSSGTAILALDWSPDGTQLLAGCGDRSARVYEAAGGRLLQTLTGHLGPVTAVGFSPDGQRLATAGAEGGVKVWETASGQGVIAFGHTAPKDAAIQPIQALAWTAGGALVTASADGTLKSWTFEGAWSERKPLGPHVFRVLSLDFNSDGTLLAAGGGEPSRSGEIKLWEVGKGMLVRSLGALHSDTVFGVRFSPDGSKLASGGADKFLKVTRVADGKELRTFEGHTHHVLAVDWKSDGKQLVSGGADNVIKLWDFESGEQLKTLPPAGKQVTAVRWVPGKPSVAGASGDKLVRLWNPDSGTNGQISRSFSGPSDYVFGVAVSNDGTRIAAGGADGVLFVWNAQNGQVLRKLEPPPPPAGDAQPPRAQLAP